MSERITVIRSDWPDLKRQRWEFAFFDHYRGSSGPVLVLDAYANETRATKRHKWQAEGETYFRLGNRRWSNFKAADVPLPDEIKREALHAIASRITVYTDTRL